MRFRVLINDRRVLGVFLLAMLFVTSAMSWRVLSADEAADNDQAVEQSDKDAADKSDSDKDATDKADVAEPESDEELGERVEVTIPPTLRSAGRRVYSVGVRLKNISEEMLEGPVRLVIEGTSVTGLEVQAAEGTNDSGEPFVELLAEGRKLAPNAKTRSRRVVFRAKESLSRKQRGDFEVQYHVTRTGLSYADREHSDKVPAVAGKGSRGKGRKRPKAGNGKVDQELVKRVIKTQDRWTDRLMKVEGVIGTATALDKRGRIVVRIYALYGDVEDKLPRTIDGTPTEVFVTWPLRPLVDNRIVDNRTQIGGTIPKPPMPTPPVMCDPLGPCDTTTGLTAKYKRPIPVGAQISNVTTNGSSGCEVGTFGAVVTDGTQTYLLSNNHVIGLSNDAKSGERIVQPGCATTQANTVATFSKLVPIVFTTSASNRVDAAIALSSDAQIDRQTACSAYGGVRTPVQAQLGDKVQKIGRTTGLKKGTVNAINGTLTVDYGTGKGNARFTGQIQIGPAGFAGPGDSGSIIVKDPSREAVALLFAGSSTVTSGNPILEVETALGVKIKCAP
jgi:hypothetical protein